MRGNYISPSELLQAQRETGKSYWDLIGQPLTPAVGYNINNPYSESEKSYKQWYNTDAKQTTQQDTKTSNDQVLNELIQKYNNLQASMNKPKEQKEYEYDDLPSFKKGKDKFTSFAQQLGPKIYKEMNKRGVYSDAAYDNVMRQLAMESSYGQSDVALKNHNYGGVGFNGKTYFNYKNDDAFVKDYIRMMKSKYGAALKAKNTTQYAKALKAGGYYQDSLENYTNKLNAMSSMSAAAKRHRLLNPKMYEYQVLLSDMEEPAVSTRVEKPINKEPIVNTPIPTEAPLIPKPEYLESNSLIRKSFAQNMNNMLQGREFQFSLPGFKGGKETIYPLGRRYWQAYSNTPTILQQKNAWVKQQKEQKDRDVKAFRKYIKTEGAKELNKEVKDYLTTSNDNTWTTSNKNPKNPHLQDRVIKGAKAHALWEKEHPVLNTWGNALGALPFAVAAAPLAAAASSGIAALGDAAAATSVGQAAIEGLTPLTTAASTSVAGAPLYTWADAGLSSLFGAHGIQTAIDEGGISPTTALEIAPLGRLAKPIFNTKIASENAASITPEVTHFYHGSPVRFDAFSADFIGSGEGGSKVMRGINLWPEEKIANAPKFANIKSPDAPLHLGVSNTPLGGELNPTVYDVSGRGLKLYTTTPRGVKGLNQSDLISQGYDGIQTPNQVTVFPESIGKLSIDKQSSIEDFVMSHPEVEKWNPWTTDTQKMQSIIDMSKMSKWTPEQWTAAQDAAIAKGDMDEARRLRDLHFKTKAPNTKVTDSVWHGSRAKNFNTFDLKYFGKTDGGVDGYGFYFGSKKHATAYKNPREFYLNMENPYTGNHAYYFNREKFFKDNELYGRILKRSDAIRYKKGMEQYKQEFLNKDGVIDTDPLWGDLGAVYVIPKSNQTKLADAVTYDDYGTRVPLGLRDNFKLKDIRYGLLPFGVGLTGYGLPNNHKKSRRITQK